MNYIWRRFDHGFSSVKFLSRCAEVINVLDGKIGRPHLAIFSKLGVTMEGLFQDTSPYPAYNNKHICIYYVLYTVCTACKNSCIIFASRNCHFKIAACFCNLLLGIYFKYGIIICTVPAPVWRHKFVFFRNCICVKVLRSVGATTVIKESSYSRV